MSDFGARVKERREHLGMSQEELASLLGYSDKSSISKIENNQRDITRGKIIEFAEVLKTTPSYLMGWTDEKEDFSRYGLTPATLHKIPLLGSVACGKPVFADQDLETYVDPKDVGADFALRAKGDSMIGDGINDGYIVYIRKQPTVDPGEIAVVLIDDEATLKHVYKRDGEIQLVASNLAYAPITIREGDGKEVSILGKAVGIYREL